METDAVGEQFGLHAYVHARVAFVVEKFESHACILACDVAVEQGFKLSRVALGVVLHAAVHDEARCVLSHHHVDGVEQQALIAQGSHAQYAVEAHRGVGGNVGVQCAEGVAHVFHEIAHGVALAHVHVQLHDGQVRLQFFCVNALSVDLCGERLAQSVGRIYEFVKVALGGHVNVQVACRSQQCGRIAVGGKVQQDVLGGNAAVLGQEEDVLQARPHAIVRQGLVRIGIHVEVGTQQERVLQSAEALEVNLLETAVHLEANLRAERCRERCLASHDVVGGIERGFERAACHPCLQVNSPQLPVGIAQGAHVGIGLEARRLLEGVEAAPVGLNLGRERSQPHRGQETANGEALALEVNGVSLAPEAHLGAQLQLSPEGGGEGLQANVVAVEIYLAAQIRAAGHIHHGCHVLGQESAQGSKAVHAHIIYQLAAAALVHRLLHRPVGLYRKDAWPTGLQLSQFDKVHIGRQRSLQRQVRFGQQAHPCGVHKSAGQAADVLLAHTGVNLGIGQPFAAAFQRLERQVHLCINAGVGREQVGVGEVQAQGVQIYARAHLADIEAALFAQRQSRQVEAQCARGVIRQGVNAQGDMRSINQRGVDGSARRLEGVPGEGTLLGVGRISPRRQLSQRARGVADGPLLEEEAPEGVVVAPRVEMSLHQFGPLHGQPQAH